MRIFFPKSAVPLIFKYQHELEHIATNTRWLYDESVLGHQVKTWNEQLSWIQPYYAMKSNPCPRIIKYLSMNNVGMDAASIKEVEMANKYVEKDRIIFTNPHTIPHEKMTIKEYLNENVDCKVLDSMCEMKKMIEYGIRPNKILVRIVCNNNKYDTGTQFDTKFGADMSEAKEIIDYGLQHKLPIKGISFHIGSGGDFPRKQAYIQAFSVALPLLEYIKTSFDYDSELPILNFGGGLLSDTDLVDTLGWTRNLPFTMMAEIGRYLSAPSYHLLTQVSAITKRGIFLDNGIYHELNVYLSDHWKMPICSHFIEQDKEKRLIIKDIKEVDEFSTKNVYGPTCDSYDVIPSCMIPSTIEVGDWLFLNEMGAYTSALSVNFNGIQGAATSSWSRV